MSEPVKDLLGNDVTKGCRIAYATHAYSQTQMTVGIVEEVATVSDRYDPDRVKTKLKVRVEATSRGWDEVVGKIVTLECLSRVVVLAPTAD